tara:strand:+ start:107 stop:1147 length:1041 start_codon:yes stop_codon:yes gene_type:complete
MKSFKIIIILVIFLKTGNVLSSENIFHVNNIELNKSLNLSSEELANKAIRKGFEVLKKKILLKDDLEKLYNLNFQQIKELVLYYQVLKQDNNKIGEDKLLFNILFDREKLHNLFFSSNIRYSEITSKEFFILPIFKQGENVLIYNKNFFYENWNKDKNNIIEFILPIENIETIQKINIYKENLIDLELESLFLEYNNKNLALILIEDTGSQIQKIFIKSKILGKNIDKTILVKRGNTKSDEFFSKIIFETKEELIELVKSQNLIDIRIPAFLNTKFIVNKKNNLSNLTRKLEKIETIENIFIQEFNKEYILIKLKYYGKLDKIFKQLKDKNINLSLDGDEWRIEII